MDRTELAAAMEAGTQVRVTEPQGAAWTGRITGLAERGMTLLTEHGHSAYLPQSCGVELAEAAAPSYLGSREMVEDMKLAAQQRAQHASEN